MHSPRFVYVLLARADVEGPNRLGITVTRKIAGAVGRNRIKRVVREVFRQHRALFPRGTDIVVIAKRGAVDITHAELLDEVRGLGKPFRAAARRSQKRGRGHGRDRHQPTSEKGERGFSRGRASTKKK